MEGLEHITRRGLSCTECDKSFSTASELNVHQRIHRGIKLFESILYQKIISQAPYLKTHIQTHTRGKDYECIFHQESFTDRINLKVHEQSHTAVKEHKCITCKNICPKYHPHTFNNARVELKFK